jgi:hypothetical protein
MIERRLKFNILKRVVSSLPAESKDIYHGLQVWAVSQAMQENNIFVTKM